METDLFKLYEQVRDCTTLTASRDALFAALASAIPELAKVVVHPEDPNRKISWSALLGDALTQNTSHVAVDPSHPGYALAYRMLTETPELDKAAYIADLEKQIATQKKAAEAVALAEAVA